MASVGRLVKESILKELSTELSGRPNFFVTALGRMPASEADALRLKLYTTSKAKVITIQRRLGLRALEPLKLDGLTQLLEGSVALVLPGDDALPAAKLIVDFVKTHEGQLAVRGAVIDGQLLDKSRVEQLANLPPKGVLLAQVVATIEAPLADVVFTLERLIGDVAWTAEQAAAKKPAATAVTQDSSVQNAPESTASQPEHSEKKEERSDDGAVDKAS